MIESNQEGRIEVGARAPRLVRTHMPRAEARRIHAFLDASTEVAVAISVFLAITLVFARIPLPEALLALAWGMAFAGIATAVATDLRSMRIPNGLGLLIVVAAGMRWAGEMLGGVRHGALPHHPVYDLVGPILGLNPAPLMPILSIDPGLFAVGIDILGMAIVLAPLYLSFAFRLGFGGGDVKLMAAASLYFGWSLGVEFLVLTYLVGLTFSLVVVAARIVARRHPARLVPMSRMARLAAMHSFPYAPAIAVAAAICLGTYVEGLIR